MINQSNNFVDIDNFNTNSEINRSFFGVMDYCFFTFRCLSFPFLEVYHVKREV